MIKTTMGHLQVNIDAKNLSFYKDLFAFLGWSKLYEDESMVGMCDKNQASFWFGQAMKKTVNDYDGCGVNHIAISAASQADVDQTVTYLQEKGVACLFETPRHRPEFSHGPDQTYYQVMFESPDKILFEVVYTGPLQK